MDFETENMEFMSKIAEENRSLEQELTFDAAEKAFSLLAVPFGREKYRVLGIFSRR